MRAGRDGSEYCPAEKDRNRLRCDADITGECPKESEGECQARSKDVRGQDGSKEQLENDGRKNGNKNSSSEDNRCKED